MYAEKTANKDKGSNETKTESVISRGIGKDFIPGCFACKYGGYEWWIKNYIGDIYVGKDVKGEAREKEVEAYMKKLTPDDIERIRNIFSHPQLMTNVSWFVLSREAGERVVKVMFNNQAFFDYRKYEPEWLQVKAGACPEHELSLEKLNDDTIKSGTITKEMVDQARNWIPRR